MKYLLTLLSFVCVTFYGYSITFNSNGIVYNITSFNSVEVGLNPSLSGSISIPSTVEYLGTNYSVTHIQDSAFYDCNALTSLSLPNSITTIGNQAFHFCSGLTVLNIPDSVSYIGSYAFSVCNALTSISLPETLTYIGEGVFLNCYSLSSIIIPQFVTSIPAKAFQGCYSLVNVVLPNNITSIGDYAFVACNSLITFNFPDELISIGNSSFYGCQFTQLSLPNTLNTIGNSAFEYCNLLTSISLPNSLVSIGHSAFNNCLSLIHITLPDSLTDLNDELFANCASLISVDLPSSLIHIGDSTFFNCESLISVVMPNSLIGIGKFSFAYCYSLVSVSFSNNLLTMGDHAFIYCHDLTKLNLPNSLTNIGSWSFEECSSLDFVKLPNTLSNISDGLFYNCYNLTAIDLPNSISIIGNESFSNCTYLKSITFPTGLTSIGQQSFYQCYSLSHVFLPNSLVNISNMAFNNSGLTLVTTDMVSPLPITIYVFNQMNIGNMTLCVPIGASNAFQNAIHWQDFGFISESIIELPFFDLYPSYCLGDSIPALPTTSNNGITGSWSPALNPSVSTVYTFTPDVGCVIATMYIQIVSPTATLSNIGTATTSTCDGTLFANLTDGVAPFIFAFNSNSPQNSNVLGNACAGFNVVTITDATGCTTSANYYLPYTVISPPLTANVIISPTSSTGVCDGQSEVLVTGGVPPYTYAHANGSTTVITSGLCEGVYGVTVTDSVGASVYIPYMVAADTNTLYIYQDTISNAYNTPPIGAIENCNINYFDIDSVSVSSVTPFAVDSVIVVWNVYSGGMLEVIPVNYFIGYGQGYYNFILDVYCPTKSSGKFLKVTAKVNVSSLLNLQQEASFWLSVYPNPFTDKIFMQLTEKDDYTVTMMDFSGRVIVSQMYKDADFVELSQLNGLAKGEYIMLIQSMNDLIVRKLVK